MELRRNLRFTGLEVERPPQTPNFVAPDGTEVRCAKQFWEGNEDGKSPAACYNSALPPGGTP